MYQYLSEYNFKYLLHAEYWILEKSKMVECKLQLIILFTYLRILN